jgi:hypothetical protein
MCAGKSLDERFAAIWAKLDDIERELVRITPPPRRPRSCSGDPYMREYMRVYRARKKAERVRLVDSNSA